MLVILYSGREIYIEIVSIVHKGCSGFIQSLSTQVYPLLSTLSMTHYCILSALDLTLSHAPGLIVLIFSAEQIVKDQQLMIILIVRLQSG